MSMSKTTIAAITIWATLVVAMIATVVWAATAGASADPGSDAASICRAIDADPTPGGVLQEGNDLMMRGFTDFQSGTLIGNSVRMTCPEHTEMIEEFLGKQGA